MPGFVVYPNAALSIRALPRPVDAAMLRAGSDLVAAASEAQAYGLAAAHLGRDEPVIVVSMAEQTGTRDYRPLYNPEITGCSGETAIGMEGSVAMPGIEAPVERALWIELAHDDENGQRRVMRLDGFVARVAQHEVDQMNGVFFLSRLSRLKRETAIRKFEKSRRQVDPVAGVRYMGRS